MKISIRATFKRRFIAGLLISIPAIITFLVIWWLFKFLDGFLEPLYYKILGYHVHGLGFISTVVLIFIVGIISTNVFGRKIIESFEHLILKIPVFKGIYMSVKQLVDAFSPESKVSSFKKFVIVEYPRPHVYAYGFLTKECVMRTLQDQEETNLKAVYIPTNLIYFGDIALFRDEHIFFTDIPIEDGIKIILSGGIATPSKISEVNG
ncbi:MAG TPA: DUF502 domain-containing protein [Thermodesulfovibrionales bacterium]|jgi:uncharacterized membrane protein|nr:DUF502 domain-containing protein [Thermodesulfovibrionales bacterium]